MPSEPDWSKEISSSSVCTWFYALAVLNALFAVAGVLGALFLSKSKGLTMPLLLSGSIGFINAWALFLVCNRGLNTEGFGKKTRKALWFTQIALGQGAMAGDYPR